MSIEDVQKKLYKKDTDFSQRRKEPKLDKHFERPDVSWQEEDKMPEDIKKEKSRTRKLLFWGISGGLLGIVALVVFFVWFIGGFDVFTSGVRNVELNVSGVDYIVSGDKTIWSVQYKNNNEQALENAIIVFEFPQGAQPVVGGAPSSGVYRERREIGRIGVGGSGIETFTAVVIGAKGDQLQGRASLEFRPEKSSARFTKKVEYSARIGSVAIGVTLQIPQELQQGQEIEAQLNIVSNSQSVFSNLAVEVEYPKGFEFVSASVEPTYGDSIWMLGDLGPGEEQTIFISGKIQQGETLRVFNIRSGIYDEALNQWSVLAQTVSQIRVRTPFLFVDAKIQSNQIAGGLVTGERYKVFVKWRNNLPVPVRNVTIEVSHEGDIFDIQSIKSENGGYIENLRTIRWIAGTVPELSMLSPGQEGELVFEFTVKNILEADIVDKNQKIAFIGKITSETVPQGYGNVDISGSSRSEYQLRTNFGFSQKGYFYDSRVENSGPLPPKVGKETTYLIVWSLTNTTNELEGISIKAALPSYMRWKDTVVPEDSGFAFNPVTGEVTWQIKRLDAGVGFTKPVKEIAFQVGLLPSTPQIDSIPVLVSKAQAIAKDTFTGAQFNIKESSVSTSLRFDPKIIGDQKRVAE